MKSGRFKTADHEQPLTVIPLDQRFKPEQRAKAVARTCPRCGASPDSPCVFVWRGRPTRPNGRDFTAPYGEPMKVLHVERYDLYKEDK